MPFPLFHVSCSVIQTFISSNEPSFRGGTRLCKVPCMLFLGISHHVFHPGLLFYLADGEQDVRFTPDEKNGSKLRHKDGHGG